MGRGQRTLQGFAAQPAPISRAEAAATLGHQLRAHPRAHREFSVSVVGKPTPERQDRAQLSPERKPPPEQSHTLESSHTDESADTRSDEDEEETLDGSSVLSGWERAEDVHSHLAAWLKRAKNPAAFHQAHLVRFFLRQLDLVDARCVANMECVWVLLRYLRRYACSHPSWSDTFNQVLAEINRALDQPLSVPALPVQL